MIKPSAAESQPQIELPIQEESSVHAPSVVLVKKVLCSAALGLSLLWVAAALGCSGGSNSADPAPAPAIASFSAASNPINAGDSTFLKAVFSGGTAVIDPGAAVVLSNVEITVQPAATTTYTLTVTNADGVKVTQSLQLVVRPGGTCTNAPDAPQHLTSPAQDAASVSLSWTPSAAGSNCTVSYLIFKDGAQVASTSAASATVSGLAASTSYSFAVKAVNGAGASALSAAIQVSTHSLPAGQISWKGYTWEVKNGSGMGPGPNAWSNANVWVDSDGYLHLKISKVNGTWYCAELGTTQALGFGTYQWQVDCKLDALDPNVVLGLFHYAGPDGTREIDIEYSRWGNGSWDPGSFTVYPETTPGTLKSTTFPMNLTGTYTTSRYIWSSTGVNYAALTGFQAIGGVANPIFTWNYTPTSPAVFIPQTAMPLRMNLWLVKGNAPQNGAEVEAIIRDFTMQ